MKTATLSLTLTCIFLHGCMGVTRWATKDVDENFLPDEHPTYGLIVLSTRFPERWRGTHIEPEFYMIYYDSFSPEASRGGAIPAAGRISDIDFQSPPGHLTIRKAAPGEHFILPAIPHSGRHSRGYGGIPFTVEAGKITYLGEFNFYSANCPFQCFTVSNQWPRDRALLQKKMKKLDLDAYLRAKPHIQAAH